MIVVSIGFDGNTMIEDYDLKKVFSSNHGYYYSKLDPVNFIANILGQLQSLENNKINKAISLARNSTTPDNAAIKIRNLIDIYKKCTDLYLERTARFKSGEEEIRDIISSYFFSEEGKKGFLPIGPMPIFNNYGWPNVQKMNLPIFKNFNAVPRVLSVEIGKDLSIGDARLFSFKVVLGYSNEQGAIEEVFTPVSEHTINISMERVDD